MLWAASARGAAGCTAGALWLSRTALSILLEPAARAASRHLHAAAESGQQFRRRYRTAGLQLDAR